MTRSVRVLTTAALAAMLAAPAAAGTVNILSPTTNSFTVTATVVASCTIAASNIAFGNYDGAYANASSDVTANGSVTAQCTTGSVPKIAVAAGANANAGIRQMVYTDSGAVKHFLKYSLYQPTGSGSSYSCPATPTTAWGDGTTATNNAALFAPGTASSFAAVTYPVCGVLPHGQDAAVSSSYSDTVNTTITF